MNTTNRSIGDQMDKILDLVQKNEGAGLVNRVSEVCGRDWVGFVGRRGKSLSNLNGKSSWMARVETEMI